MDFDVIVIGAGPGGYVCAIRAAQLGLKTACVEARASLGGTCLNVGCIPSKALLESSHHYHKLIHEYSDHGIYCDTPRFDLDKMQGRKGEVVNQITGGVEYLFKKNKVTWLKGMGRVVGSGRVEVKDSSGALNIVSCEHVVIATGSAPIELPFAPFDHELVVDSTDALNFSRVPETMVVVGGGVIGLELGSVWSRLGAKVTVIEAQDRILPEMDRSVSETMFKILSKQGIGFELNSLLKKVEPSDSLARIQYQDQKNQSCELEAEKVLVAVGRKAYTSELGLDSLGVELDKLGRVPVDEGYRTSVAKVYAIGDVISGPMLAHKAEEEGVAVAENIAGHRGHVNYRAIPNVVYTWPEIASVGLTEQECQAQGHKYKEGRFFFKANGRARAAGEADGFVKIYADASTDRVLGVHILGANASELIGEVAVAMEYGASSEDIARSVHAHPTLTEAIKEAALDVENRAIHS